MRLDCFCGLGYKVCVHTCRTSECDSQLRLRVTVVYLVMRKSDSALPAGGQANYAHTIAEQGEEGWAKWCSKGKRETIQYAGQKSQTNIQIVCLATAVTKANV